MNTVANSLGMNGVGKDTVVHASTPGFTNIINALKVLFPVLFAGSFGMYIFNRIKFNKTDAYLNYQKFKKERKAK